MSFELASASIVGIDHRHPLKESNGHDALAIEIVPDTPWGAARICLVVDGCGSGLHSEVGAQIGVRLLAAAIKRQLTRWRKDEDPPRLQFNKILERARLDVLARLRVLVQDMGGSFSQTVNDYFLFTVVGAILTQEFSCFFSRGDGLIVVCGEEHWIEPDEGNAPVYLAYALVESSLTDHRPEALKFDILQVVATQRLEHFLIGTDGLRHFVDAGHLALPGKTELVGPLSQFWEEDRYFTNPDNVRRRLALVNRTAVQPHWDARRLVTATGHLKDDTTLIVGRRIVCES